MFSFPTIAADHERDATFLDTFPGTSKADATLLPCGNNQDRPRWSELHTAAELTVQFYNFLRLTPRQFHLESDRLGSKPVYEANLNNGLLLASRLRDLFAIDSTLIQPLDQIGLSELALFRAPLGARTLHQKVKRAEAGACYHWDTQEGLTTTRDRRVSLPPIRYEIGLSSALEEMKESLASSLRNRLGNLATPILLPLSGGFDSRLLAAIVCDLEIPIEFFSYGRRRHRELRTAKKIARTLGAKHHLLAYSVDNIFTRLPVHLDSVEAQADLSSTQVGNLLDIAYPSGSPLVHGYLGLGGASRRYIPHHSPGSLDELTEILVQGFASQEKLTSLQATLDLTISLDGLHEEVRNTLSDECPPYQAVLLWDLEERQHRFISSHFQILGNKFHTIAPYYDNDVMQSWLSFPRMALDNRYLHRQLILRYFPELARIPKDDERHPILPNLRYQLPESFRSLPIQVARQFFGPRVARRIHRQLAKRTNIWSLATAAATSKQHKHVIRRIQATAPVTAQVLDLAVEQRSAPLAHADHNILRCLLLIGEYALWLERLLRSR